MTLGKTNPTQTHLWNFVEQDVWNFLVHKEDWKHIPLIVRALTAETEEIPHFRRELIEQLYKIAENILTNSTPRGKLLPPDYDRSPFYMKAAYLAKTGNALSTTPESKERGIAVIRELLPHLKEISDHEGNGWHYVCGSETYEKIIENHDAHFPMQPPSEEWRTLVHIQRNSKPQSPAIS